MNTKLRNIAFYRSKIDEIASKNPKLTLKEVAKLIGISEKSFFSIKNGSIRRIGPHLTRVIDAYLAKDEKQLSEKKHYSNDSENKGIAIQEIDTLKNIIVDLTKKIHEYEKRFGPL